jgi:DnaJ-class molecular chaperone
MIRSEKDYYAVLGINSKSSQEDIKKAFKKLALKCHPDHHPDDPKAEERFKDINEAYGVLSSPDKRKQYDLFQSYGGNSSQYKYSVDPSGGLNVNFGFDVFENAFDFIFLFLCPLPYMNFCVARKRSLSFLLKTSAQPVEAQGFLTCETVFRVKV